MLLCRFVAKTSWLGEEAVQEGHDPEGEGGDEGGRGDRQYPGPNYPPGDAPLNCRQATGRAHTDDRTGDRVCG